MRKVCSYCKERFLCLTTKTSRYFIVRRIADMKRAVSHADTEDRHYDVILKPLVIHNGSMAHYDDCWSYPNENSAVEAASDLNRHYPWYIYTVESALCKKLLPKDYIILPEGI